MRENAIVWMDTVTKLDQQHAGAVAVVGSHGGEYAAYCAACAQVRAAIFNDATVGKDAEGIHALRYFDALGVAAATTDHASARIGDGRDNLEYGRISHVNQVASALGCHVDQRTRDCAQHMLAAPVFTYAVPFKEESRHVMAATPEAPIRVVVVDSLSLVLPEDMDAIVVAGSHGAILPMEAGQPLMAGHVMALLCCDAGFGKDDNAVSRIRALDATATPAAAVSVASARIGHGMSMLNDGVLSFVNQTAARHGARVGMTARQYVARLQDVLHSAKETTA